MKTKSEKIICATIWTILTLIVIAAMIYPLWIYFGNYYIYIINGVRITKNINVMILNMLGGLLLNMLFCTIKAIGLVFEKKCELKIIENIKHVFMNKTILSTILATLLFIIMVFIIRFHHINIYNSGPLYYKICSGLMLNVLGILLWKILSYAAIGILVERRR